MKDYAPHHSPKRPNVGRKGRWLLFVMALVAVVVFLIHAVKHKTTPPVVRSVVIAPQPAQQSGVTGQHAAEQFDFYTLLPKATVVTPKPLSALAPQPDKKMTYVLQVASVSSPSDAKHKRDQLVRMGYTSFVKPSPSDKQRWYRVMIGPYPTRRLAEKDQRQLYRQEHLNSMLIQKAT